MKRLLLAALPLLLAACGNKMAGTYACEGVGYVTKVELTSDGKIFAEADVFGNVQKTAGTYEVEGKRLIGTVNGETSVFDIEDGNLLAHGGKCVQQ